MYRTLTARRVYREYDNFYTYNMYLEFIRSLLTLT